MGGPIILWPPGVCDGFPGCFVGEYVGQTCEDVFFGFYTCNAFSAGVVCCPY